MNETSKMPPPFALSVGVCDLLYRDRGTGKRFILGCFSTIHAKLFPVKHPALGVYLDLTNGRGQVSIKVQIIDSDEDREPIWTTELEFDFSDPRMVAELDFMVGGLEFPEPGEYRVQAFANGEFIIERRLLLIRVETKNE